MIIKIFLKNHDYSLKQKIINFSIIFLIFIFITIQIWFKNNSSDPNYLKIRNFEYSISKSFMGRFFENKIWDMKKFRDLNYRNLLLDHGDFIKSENPDVSVIITAFNQAHCFYSALRSVQNQSLKNIEIIIIDDCSLDNTSEVIEKYMKEDERINLFIQ